MVVFFDIETTGLNPYEGQVILVGMKREGKIRQWKIWEIGDEGQLIMDVIEEFTKIDLHDTITGFNSAKFDLHFLSTRLSILGKMNSEIWTILHDRKWFDLYQFLGNDFQSLRLWLGKFEVRREYPELNGKDVPGYFARKEYDKIVKHNEDDLNTSEELVSKLRKAKEVRVPDLLHLE